MNASKLITIQSNKKFLLGKPLVNLWTNARGLVYQLQTRGKELHLAGGLAMAMTARGFSTVIRLNFSDDNQLRFTPASARAILRFIGRGEIKDNTPYRLLLDGHHVYVARQGPQIFLSATTNIPRIMLSNPQPPNSPPSPAKTGMDIAPRVPAGLISIAVKNSLLVVCPEEAAQGKGTEEPTFFAFGDTRPQYQPSSDLAQAKTILESYRSGTRLPTEQEAELLPILKQLYPPVATINLATGKPPARKNNQLVALFEELRCGQDNLFTLLKTHMPQACQETLAGLRMPAVAGLFLALTDPFARLDAFTMLSPANRFFVSMCYPQVPQSLRNDHPFKKTDFTKLNTRDVGTALGIACTRQPQRCADFLLKMQQSARNTFQSVFRIFMSNLLPNEQIAALRALTSQHVENIFPDLTADTRIQLLPHLTAEELIGVYQKASASPDIYQAFNISENLPPLLTLYRALSSANSKRGLFLDNQLTIATRIALFHGIEETERQNLIGNIPREELLHVAQISGDQTFILSIFRTASSLDTRLFLYYKLSHQSNYSGLLDRKLLPNECADLWRTAVRLSTEPLPKSTTSVVPATSFQVTIDTMSANLLSKQGIDWFKTLKPQEQQDMFGCQTNLAALVPLMALSREIGGGHLLLQAAGYRLREFYAAIPDPLDRLRLRLAADWGTKIELWMMEIGRKNIPSQPS